MQKQQYSCQHFCRKVKVVCPDCQETHGCHYCHDAKWEFAKKKSHIMRWKEVEQVVCAKCQTKQPVSNQCIRQKCGNKFGNYFCAQCRVWTFNPQPIFHCDDCNTCHQAIKGQVKHCSSCKMCINKEEFEEHQNHCNPQKLLDDCCICQEPLLRGLSDIKRVPCGHLMHSHCVEQYAVAKIEDFYKGNGFTIGCPLCKKSILPIDYPDMINR